jgi:LuxR family transcriptional regulator, maltose regulon positive regulatory protein
MLTVSLASWEQPSVPRPLDFEVLRPRLLERLKMQQHCRVRVLAAPSGYGKSTLVAQAVREGVLREPGAQESGTGAVWLQLVSDDADVLYLAQSLYKALRLESLAEPPARRLADQSIHAVTELLKTALRAMKSLDLVLDNLEHLGEAARSWLSDLLAADLGGTRLWLIGYDLEHLRLARLVGRGEAVMLTQDDLRFDVAETQLVLAARQSGEQPEEVCTKLEGWPAGVGLIAVGVSPHITPTNLIFDAVSQLPADLRDALPEVAVLEVWSEAAAQQLGCALPAGWLSEVRRAGLPVTQLQPDVYRPHLTLLQALEHRLQANSARHAELHGAAARRDVKSNELLSAVRHALKANDRPLALEVAEGYVDRLSARGEHGLVKSVLEEIGEPLTPALLGLLGVALIKTGATDKGQGILNGLQTSGELTPVAAFALGSLSLRKSEPENALKYALHGQQLPGNALEKGRCRRLEGWAYLSLERFEEAKQCAEMEVARAESEQNLEELASSLMLATSVYSALGQHVSRENSIRRSVQVSDLLGSPRHSANARNDLADLYRLKGCFDLATTELDQTIADIGNIDDEVIPYLYETLGDVYLWQHSLEQAIATYRQAVRLAKRLDQIGGLARMQLRLVGGLLQAGHRQEAAVLLEILGDPGKYQSLRIFMTALAAFETNPKQAVYLLESNLSGLETEWAVRVAALLAELARRAGTLGQQHAERIVQALEAHGFDTALFVDIAQTAPALLALAQAGWLPTRLHEPLRQLTQTELALKNTEQSEAAAPDRVLLEVQTFGQRRVLVNGVLVNIRLAKSFEVLVYLLCRGASTRETILEAVWNTDSPQSREYFKVALRRLRADLSAHPAVNFEAVTFDRSYEVAQNFDAQLDLIRLEAAVKQPYDPSLDVLLAGMQGEFLPGASGDWVEPQREQNLEYRLLAHLKVGNALLETEPFKAAEAFRAALALDPYSGECLVNLFLALLAAGDPVAARQAVERYELGVRRDLNVEPDPAIRARLAGLGLG